MNMKINIPMTLTIDIPTNRFHEISDAYEKLDDSCDLIEFYESFGVDLNGIIS